MKKTLFIAALAAAAQASATDDVFVPQSIITVAENYTAKLDDSVTAENVKYSTSTTDTEAKTIADVLAQKQQFTKNYTKRSAIVKDGQGTLSIETDVNMNAPLLVREGKVEISAATVKNAPISDGNNLSVSGINAELILDNSTYSCLRADSTNVSYSSSISVGATDGDGKLTLKNGSVLKTQHGLFSGCSSNIPMPDAEDPTWNANPHRGGSYTQVDTDSSSTTVVGEGNSYYANSSDHAGFSNQTVLDGGARLSTATINVLSGSTLQTGSGIYLYNSTMNVDGVGTQVISGAINNNDYVSIGGSFGTKGVLNITNGAKWTTAQGAGMTLGYYDGQQGEITVSGQGSEFNFAPGAWVGKGTGTSVVTVTDGGSMTFGSWVWVRGNSETHQFSVSGEGSQLNADEFDFDGGSVVKVADKATMSADSYMELQGSSSASIESGASLSAKELQINEQGTCSVDKTSTIKAEKLTVNDGGSLTNNGTISALSVEGGTSAISIAQGGTIVNNGTLDATVTVEGMLKGSGTFNKDVTVSSAGTLIVGNSPGYQTMNGNLELADGSTTVFCIAGTTASSEGNTGWASHTCSQISMASGSLTLDGNANITIEFGGDVMATDAQWQKEQEFSVTLVKGGCASLNNADILETLRAHTTFKLTDETAGRTGLSTDKTWGVAVSNASYSIVNGTDLVLSGKMMLTPEPATATLSLLALAGLAARRRRR